MLKHPMKEALKNRLSKKSIESELSIKHANSSDGPSKDLAPEIKDTVVPGDDALHEVTGQPDKAAVMRAKDGEAGGHVQKAVERSQINANGKSMHGFDGTHIKQGHTEMEETPAHEAGESPAKEMAEQEGSEELRQGLQRMIENINEPGAAKGLRHKAMNNAKHVLNGLRRKS